MLEQDRKQQLSMLLYNALQVVHDLNEVGIIERKNMHQSQIH